MQKMEKSKTIEAIEKLADSVDEKLVEKNEQLAKANSTIVELQKSKIHENVTRIPIQEVP